ncbi:MAG: ROK family protein [Acidimicrobiales bacterium]|jgi:glucokinase
MAEVVALDIGGSGIRAARVQDGEIVRRARLELIPGTAPDQAGETLRAALSLLEPSSSDGALGVAFPGFLDGAGRVLPGIYLPGFVGMDFVDTLGPLMAGRPMAVVPDVAAAALAEAAATDSKGRLLCVCLGTGANAALVADGVVVDLAAGCLGDAGHVVVDPDGPACTCGGRGCLEAMCSGRALARDGTALGFVDAAAVCEAARAMDERAVDLVERAGRALGRALSSWAAMTFPDVVCVTGGLSLAGELLLTPARREMRRVGPPEIVARLDVRIGRCGADAALLGAAIEAQRVQEADATAGQEAVA